MPTFTDSQQHEWNCRVDWAGVRRLKEIAGVVVPGDSAVIMGDVVLQMDALWAVCSVQAAMLGVDKEQFEERVHPAFGAATEALGGGLQDFSRELAKSHKKPAVAAT